MKASEKSLTFLRDQVIYVVPYFQRGYVWVEENWEGIWDELTADRKDCFLGSIILKEEKYASRPETCKTIIDGQQRLTTLTILLRAFLDYYTAKGADAVTLQQFRQLIFYPITEWLDTGVITKEICRIEHSRLNKVDYKNIIEGKANLDEIVMDSTQGALSNSLLRCYKFFSEKLADASTDEIKMVRQKLIVDSSKILVVIDLNEDENEQVIFDTINSTGVRLTASDIIKNAVFQKIKKSGEDVEEIYETTWKKCFEDDAETLNMWLETKGLGQNQRSNIDLFFYSFSIIEGFFKIPGDKMSNLAERYKEHIAKMSSKDAKKFIYKICEYAETYRDTFIGFDGITAYSYTDGKQRLLQILSTIKITAFDPFILYAIKTYDEEKQETVFSQLECYVMRHYIIGNASKMGSFLQDAVEMINGKFKYDEKLSDELISDARLEHALKYINNTKAKLALFWIELRRHTRKESDLYLAPLPYAYELEHIMPQKWVAHWGLNVLPILDEAGEPLRTEDASRIRSEAVYEIGNMTLLSSKLNKELQNYCFADKVKGTVINNKPKPGMAQFASLSITKEVINVDPLVWNEDRIHERTKQLTKEFKDIWPYCKPAVNVAESI